MIILNPDEISVHGNGSHRVRKVIVGLHVCIPVRFIKVDFAGEIVEQWPEYAILRGSIIRRFH